MNVIIVSEVVGRYKKINVKEGQFVEKGTLLAVINSDVIDNNLKEIETNLKLLKTIYDRQSNLWENNIGSELDYLRAKSNYESLKSRFNAIKLQASRFKIIAPLPMSRISIILVDIIDFVSKSIFKIRNNQPTLTPIKPLKKWLK